MTQLICVPSLREGNYRGSWHLHTPESDRYVKEFKWLTIIGRWLYVLVWLKCWSIVINFFFCLVHQDSFFRIFLLPLFRLSFFLSPFSRLRRLLFPTQHTAHNFFRVSLLLSFTNLHLRTFLSFLLSFSIPSAFEYSLADEEVGYAEVNFSLCLHPISTLSHEKVPHLF